MPLLKACATLHKASSLCHRAKPCATLHKALSLWHRAEPRATLPGWLLIGGCGWVKNEGLLFLPLVWDALRYLPRGATCRDLLLGLALPAGWLAWPRLQGGVLYDYAPPWQPDGRQLFLLLQPQHVAFDDFS